MWEIVFWSSLLATAYVYLGYPAALALWRRLDPKPPGRGGWEPLLSLVLAVHNERSSIDAKLDNCLSLDYPGEKLQIVVALDGPTDGTDEVVRNRGERLDVVSLSDHRGKAAALNAAVKKSHGEIVVFTDARQQLDRGALRELSACFSDPSVGAVSGELVLAEEGESSDGVGLYWRYEKTIRAMESDVHSSMGATGAIYAVRRELVVPLPEDAILDDVWIPMSVVLGGRRVVFEKRARAYEPRRQRLEDEFRRKVRTLAGNYQLLTGLPWLLHPARNPVFFQFVSHKVGRLLVPWCLGSAFVSNLLLSGWFYEATLLAQAGFYCAAGLGWLWKTSAGARSERPPGILRALLVAYTFVMLNTAAIVGLIRFLAGPVDVHRKLWRGGLASSKG